MCMYLKRLTNPQIGSRVFRSFLSSSSVNIASFSHCVRPIRLRYYTLLLLRYSLGENGKRMERNIKRLLTRQRSINKSYN